MPTAILDGKKIVYPKNVSDEAFDSYLDELALIKKSGRNVWLNKLWLEGKIGKSLTLVEAINKYREPGSTPQEKTLGKNLNAKMQVVLDLVKNALEEMEEEEEARERAKQVPIPVVGDETDLSGGARLKDYNQFIRACLADKAKEGVKGPEAMELCNSEYKEQESRKAEPDKYPKEPEEKPYEEGKKTLGYQAIKPYDEEDEKQAGKAPEKYPKAEEKVAYGEEKNPPGTPSQFKKPRVGSTTEPEEEPEEKVIRGRDEITMEEVEAEARRDRDRAAKAKKRRKKAPKGVYTGPGGRKLKEPRKE